MGEYRLRVLHLSDLHERVAYDWMKPARQAQIAATAGSRHRVLDDSNFYDVLQEICAGGPPHLVCFSGDITDWGLPREYAAATKRLLKILDTVGAPLERFFVVPGNHDVARSREADGKPNEKTAWRRMRKLAEAHAPELSDWMAGMERPLGAGCLARRHGAAAGRLLALGRDRHGPG